MVKFDILSLFPDMFSSPLNEGILKRAQDKRLIEVSVHNLRDFSEDKHCTADDYPYGGGGGMVMKPDLVVRGIEKVRTPTQGVKVVLMTPQGKRFDHNRALRLAECAHLVIVCGRYEGIDERVRVYVDEEISIGDYVLSGGELAAMVLLDAVTRLIPGVLGNPVSAKDESFSNRLLEYPQYTRPRAYRGLEVPEILLSGDHERINRWRYRQSLKRTLERRPDLLEQVELSDEDLGLLSEIREDLNPDE